RLRGSLRAVGRREQPAGIGRLPGDRIRAGEGFYAIDGLADEVALGGPCGIGHAQDRRLDDEVVGIGVAEFFPFVGGAGIVSYFAILAEGAVPVGGVSTLRFLSGIEQKLEAVGSAAVIEEAHRLRIGEARGLAVFLLDGGVNGV